MTVAGVQRIAVFGDHAMVLEVAKHLQYREHAVLIVDDKLEHLERAREHGFDTAQLDFTDDAELWTVLADKATTTVVSLFDSDAENVFLIISARALKPELKIVTIAESTDSVAKLLAAGANKIINPHEIGGRKLWGYLERPVIAEILDHTLFSSADLNMAEMEVAQSSPVRGRRFGELLESGTHNAVLLGLVRAGNAEDFVFSMRALNHVLHAGDMLVVIGPKDDLARMRRELIGPGS